MTDLTCANCQQDGCYPCPLGYHIPTEDRFPSVVDGTVDYPEYTDGERAIPLAFGV